MSNNEFHYGKLQRVDLEEKTLEEFFKQKCEEENLEMKEHYEGWEELYRNMTNNYEKYYVSKGVVWETIEHEQADDYYMDKLIPNADGTYTFIMSFYNGGTCLSEMIEESLNSLSDD